VTDGIDQTDLILNGDTHGRRDHVFVYTNDKLGAIVKDDTKFHVNPTGHGASSGVAPNTFDLLNDPREESPMLIQQLHKRLGFDRMMNRHLNQIKKFPHAPQAHGPALTGIENARPETLEVAKLYEPREEDVRMDE
jgi:arylsulfatase